MSRTPWHFFNLLRVLSVISLFGLATPALAALGQVFNDGGTHTVNTNLAPDSIEVRGTTTVHVENGAVLGTSSPLGSSISTFDTAQLEMSGGMLNDELFLFGSSHANITGGHIVDDITSGENSSVDIHSVTVDDDLEANTSSLMNIYGGSFDEDVESFDNATVNFHGGTFQTGADGANVEAAGHSHINIHGGTFGVGHTDAFGGINAIENAVVNIYGGDIHGQPEGLNASDNGVINVYGVDSQPAAMNTTGNGLINVYGGLTDLAASGSGLYQLLGGGSQLTSIHTNGTISLFIRGSSFALNGAAKSGLLTSIGGNLTGVLADGSTLNVSLTRGSLVPAQTIFLLPVPEPGTMGLASFAVASCLGFVGRRRISP
jgi:hypothetical protein